MRIDFFSKTQKGHFYVLLVYQSIVKILETLPQHGVLSRFQGKFAKNLVSLAHSGNRRPRERMPFEIQTWCGGGEGDQLAAVSICIYLKDDGSRAPDKWFFDMLR